MKVSQWAEIRRLAEVERLSQRQIARRLRCCWRTVKKALAMEQPPDETQRARRGSILDPYKPKIDALIAKYPDLSAARVLEEIRKPPVIVMLISVTECSSRYLRVRYSANSVGMEVLALTNFGADPVAPALPSMVIKSGPA